MVDKSVMSSFGRSVILALDSTNRGLTVDTSDVTADCVACVLSIDEATESIVMPDQITYFSNCDLCCTPTRFAHAYCAVSTDIV